MFLSRKGEPHDHFVKMKKDQVYQLNVGDIFSLVIILFEAKCIHLLLQVLLDYKYRLCAVSTFTGKREKTGNSYRLNEPSNSTDDCYKPRCPYAAKCYRQSEDHFQVSQLIYKLVLTVQLIVRNIGIQMIIQDSNKKHCLRVL
jgi:hypothetical protein